MKKLLQLSFVPHSTDFAILVLRLWFGLTLFFNHGWAKLVHCKAVLHSGMLPDPLDLGAKSTLALAIVAEVFCSACIVLGVATRLAALIQVIEFAVAFFLVHHAVLAMGPGSGELAFLYLGAALTLVFSGCGRFSVCSKSNLPPAPAPAA